MSPRKDRRKPTHYPGLFFHSVRSAQLTSSLVVASIMVYFLKELALDNYRLPWTFILLFAISLLTIIALSITIVVHCLYGLNPVLNTTLNSSLALLWAVSFSLLSWWSSSTLTHVCNVNKWDSDIGVSVCRLYKALFSFALLGLVSTITALGLDISVQRSVTKRGRFQQLQMLDRGRKPNADGQDLDMNPNPIAAREYRAQQGKSGDGYALPEAQFDYQSTAYRGSADYMDR